MRLNDPRNTNAANILIYGGMAAVIASAIALCIAGVLP